jgi:hypothetical protein
VEGSVPPLRSAALKSGELIARTISVLRRVMTSGAVFAGADSPNQLLTGNQQQSDSVYHDSPEAISKTPFSCER